MSASVALVLAAGRSTRMKSVIPKVLHEVCGRPLIEYLLDSVREAGVGRIVVIVGHGADQVRKALAKYPGVEFALQSEQKGTGHAVMMCQEQMRTHEGPALVLMGDAPLVRPESLSGLISDLADNRAAAVVGTAETDNNFGLGRIVRSPEGEFLRIVEQRDASPAEQAIREINVGCYAFDCRLLFEALAAVRPTNVQGEYYLTDVMEILRRQNHPVIASKRLTIEEALGVNTRGQLADINRTLQGRYLTDLMAAGVTICDPGSTYVDLRARISPDTVIHPFTAVMGPCVIGSNCRIGPHVVIEDTNVPDGTMVEPFTHLRPRP